MTVNALIETADRAEHADVVAILAGDDLFALTQRGQTIRLESVEWPHRHGVQLVHPWQVGRDVDLGVVIQQKAYQFKELDLS